MEAEPSMEQKTPETEPKVEVGTKPETEAETERTADVENSHTAPVCRVSGSFVRCPECGLMYSVHPHEISHNDGDPTVVECGVCKHVWFTTTSELIVCEDPKDNDHPARVAARNRKKGCTELIPSQPATVRATNISLRTTSSILKKVFSAYGRVLRSELIPALGPHDRPTGLVEMSSEEEAREAIAGLNDTNIFGSRMYAELADANAFDEVPALELSLFDDYGDVDDFVVSFDGESEEDQRDLSDDSGSDDSSSLTQRPTYNGQGRRRSRQFKSSNLDRKRGNSKRSSPREKNVFDDNNESDKEDKPFSRRTNPRRRDS